MAILVHLKSEVLCLSCHRWVLTPWKSYMVCIHIVGVWKFLRIGAGADSVKVTFCTVCPACPGGKAIATGDLSGEDVGEDKFDEAEDKLYKIQLLAASKPLRDTMTNIKKGNDIVIIKRFEVVERWLTKVRPLFVVGKDVRFLCDDLPEVSAGGEKFYHSVLMREQV